MKVLHGLVILLSLCVASLPARSETETQSGFERLTVDELCELRGDADAVAELKRRDLFSRSELRAIRKQQARDGIGAEALVCALGAPDRIELSGYVVEGVQGSDRVYQFRYSTAGDEGLVVHVRHGDDGASSVISPPLPSTKSSGPGPDGYVPLADRYRNDISLAYGIIPEEGHTRIGQ